MPDESRTQSPNRHEPEDYGEGEKPASRPKPQNIEAMFCMALLAADLLQRLENRYLDVLEEYNENFLAQESQKVTTEHQTHFKRLRTRDGRRILEIVWKETCEIPAISISLAGVDLNFSDKCINSNSLACEIHSSQVKNNHTNYDAAHAVAQTVSRIIEAAEYFRLIAKGAPQGKSIPIIGTKALSELMLKCHVENGMLIDSLYSQTDPLPTSRPGT